MGSFAEFCSQICSQLSADFSRTHTVRPPSRSCEMGSPMKRRFVQRALRRALSSCSRNDSRSANNLPSLGAGHRSGSTDDHGFTVREAAVREGSAGAVESTDLERWCQGMSAHVCVLLPSCDKAVTTCDPISAQFASGKLAYGPAAFQMDEQLTSYRLGWPSRAGADHPDD